MLSYDCGIFIVGGSILLLSHELNQRVWNDVLDSTLYMQLASETKQSSLADYEQWWVQYSSQFNQFGWTRLQSFGGGYGPDSEQSLQSLRKIVASKLSLYLSSTSIEAVDRALIELTRLPTHSAVRAQLRQYSLVEDRVSNLTTVRLQLGIALKGSRFICLSFSFTTRETLPNSGIEHLFQTNDIVGEIKFNGCVAVLDSTAFELWRQRIGSVVAPAREDLIRAVHSLLPNQYAVYLKR